MPRGSLARGLLCPEGMSSRRRLYPWLALIAIASFSGCGGAADGGEAGATGGEQSAGGMKALGGASSNGGMRALGGASAGGAMSTGGISTSGAPGSGGGGCCLAAAQCNDGDKQLPYDQACPMGFDCYTNTICCSTVWCAHPQTQCTAVPSCNPGDRQLMGACPPSENCYSVTDCGKTVWCWYTPGAGGAPGTGGAPNTGGAPGSAGAAGASCDPASELDRHYMAKSPETCALIDFTCPEYTTYFGNDCGCGCEQDASCPDSLDCQPGPQTQHPLCSGPEAAQCPYTLRLL